MPRWRRTSNYGRVLPGHRWQGLSRGTRFWRALRPWLGAALVIAAAWYFMGQQRIGPDRLPEGPADRVSGRFTRCGAGSAPQCVIDGDTLVIGARTIRVVGIDAPELHPARCAEEARLGEAAAQRLLDLLNQGPFVLAAPGANAHDGYGRELRHVLRGRADGSVQSIADDMVASGAARAYQRSARLPWC